MRGLLRELTFAALVVFGFVAIPVFGGSDNGSLASDQFPSAALIDEFPPELIVSIAAGGAVEVSAIDGMDPEPSVLQSISSAVSGVRRVERHDVEATDETGNWVAARLRVSQVIDPATGGVRIADARFDSLSYSNLPSVGLPRHELRASLGMGGTLRQSLYIAGALEATVEHDGLFSTVRVLVSQEARRLSMTESGLISLELMTSQGGLTMRTSPGAEGDVLVDWEKLLAPSLPASHQSHATPGFRETSEYMLGTVAVQVVLLESNGALDPNVENWNVPNPVTGANRINEVIGEISQGIGFWTTQAQQRGYPLTFTVDFTRALAPVATSYEPISRPAAQENLWITDALNNINAPAGANIFQRERALLNNLRTTQATDWAFLIYVVDSLVDTDERFADLFFAYAYLGGPHLVMTYDNDGWGIAAMDQVVAHEIGHIFYALDEYVFTLGCPFPAPFDAAALTGYLAVTNPNCEQMIGPAGTPVLNPAACNCLMRNNNLQLSPGTVDQIAWRDSDADGVPDVLDTVPRVVLLGPGCFLTGPIGGRFTLRGCPGAYRTPFLTFRGIIETSPLRNMNPWNPGGRDAGLDTIAAAEFRVDSGPWILIVAPDDFAYGGQHESVTFSILIPPPNPHTVQLRARNLMPPFGSFTSPVTAFSSQTFRIV